MFQKSGEFWMLGDCEAPIHVKDSKGLGYIEHLLRNPGVEFHVFDLIGLGDSAADRSAASLVEFAGATRVGRREALSDAGELLDDKTRAAYRDRLTELRDLIDDAKQRGDADAVARAEDEIDALSRELSRAVGKGGRQRRAASAVERARVAVTKAIKYSIDKIRQNDVALSQTLERSIRTGTFCVYRPDPLDSLKWELGSPETDDADSPTPTAPTDAGPGPRDVSDQTSAPGLIVVGKRTQFVGREAEREQIAAAFKNAMIGAGSVVLIASGPGVGKSRLALECAREASARAGLALTGRCYQTQEPHPYIPFVEIIDRALANAPSKEVFRHALADNAPELAQIAPRLRRSFPDIPAPLNLPPQQARRYLFDSLHEFLARSARAQPIFLILDDLHWADDATLSLLLHLARRIIDVPAVIVGTYRDTPVDFSESLTRALEDLIREGVRPIRLRGLPKPAVARMIQALCGAEPPEKLADAIHDETEGNPFFVEELVKHLIEDNQLFDAEGRFSSALGNGAIAVPQSVGLVIGRRLDRLSQPTREVLDSAATIGRRFDFELLESLVGSGSQTVLDALDEALKSGLIYADSKRRPALAFAHEIARQTILSRVSPPRLQRLHLRVARLLEERYAESLDEHAADIADHLLAAGPTAQPAQVSDYLARAGRHAMRASAYDEAWHHFETALQHLPPGESETRAQLLCDLGMTKRSLDRWEEALAHWRESLKFYGASGDLSAVGRLSFTIVEALSWAGRHFDALRMAEEALAQLKDSVSVDHARLLGAVGMINSAAGVYQPAHDALAEAFHLAEQLDDPKAVGAVLSYRAFHNFVFLRLDEAISDGMRCAQILRAEAAFWSLAQLLGFLQTAMFEMGRLREALVICDELEPMAARLGHSAAMMLQVRIKAWCDFCQNNDLDALEKRFARDLEITQAARLPWVATSHAQLGLINFLRGDWDAALRRCEVACAAEFPNAFDGFAAGLLFRQRAYMGDRQGALELLADKRDRLPVLGSANPTGSWALLMMVVEGLYVLDERQQAADLYPLAVQGANLGVRCLTVISRVPHLTAGLAAVAARQWHRAEEHFNAALADAEAMPHPLEAAEARRFYGQMLIERAGSGDFERALPMLVLAREAYTRMRMPRHCAIIEALENSRRR
jgi:tetratricopeptide (TPR) repeat protein